MGEDADDPDPAVFIIGVVLLAFLCLAILRCCDYWCKRVCREQKDDVEHLDPSIEIKSDYPACVPFFSCCSETSEENECELGSNKKGDEPNSGSGPPKTVPTAQDNAALSLAGSNQQVDGSNKCVDISSINVALKYLQNQQQSEPSENSAAKLARIRLVQNLVLLDKVSKPTEESMGAALIIGVDATPKVLGGYCVNLREMRIDYYVIKMEDFPWPMENLDDPVEFEMKNMLFALAIWSESIKKFKKFIVYTDNNGIKGKSEFGLDAEDLLSHLTSCEDAILVNRDEVYVNRMRDLAAFAKYIQPADDLSRWQIDKAIDFLCKFYGIHANRAKGTVKLTRHGTTETKPWYDPSDAYQAKLDLAQVFAYKFHCENCDIGTFG